MDFILILPRSHLEFLLLGRQFPSVNAPMLSFVLFSDDVDHLDPVNVLGVTLLAAGGDVLPINSGKSQRSPRS